MIIYRRSILKITSSVLMILVSILPYSDIFLSFFINMEDIKTNRFPTFAAMIYNLAASISPILILGVSKLKPWWATYLVPIYVYLSIFLGFLYLEINIYIESDWVFRGSTFLLSLIIILLSKKLLEYSRILALKDSIIHEIKVIENEK